jgi:cytoskeletal protein CcmA (bactofilin family)
MNPASTIICDVKIKGTLEFSESLFLDCQFEGDIISDGKLTIGEHANVQGQIQADSVIIFGNIRGDIVVTDSCKIKSTATLIGDTKAQKLEISEGAIIQGCVTVPFHKEEVVVSVPEEIGPENLASEENSIAEKETESADIPDKSDSEDETRLEEETEIKEDMIPDKNSESSKA